MKATTKNDLAKALFQKLSNHLTNDHKRQVSDLRCNQNGFLVSHRTMEHLKAGELCLRPKRIKEICEKLGLNFYLKEVYFSDFEQRDSDLTRIEKLKKEYKIYSCSNWSNKRGDWAKITFAAILGTNTVGTQETVTIERCGGRWQCLASYIFADFVEKE